MTNGKSNIQNNVDLLPYMLSALAQAKDSLDPASVTYKTEKELAQNFKAALRDHLASLDDPQATLAVAHYFQTRPDNINMLINSLMDGKPFEGVVRNAVSFAETTLEAENRQDRRWAQNRAYESARDFGFEERHARYIGLDAARAGQTLRSDALETGLEDNPQDAENLGVIVAAKRYMGVGLHEEITAYEVYDAIVMSEDAPEGLVKELEVVRALQAVQSGETPVFENDVHEMAVRLRQAIDDGMDPDTEITTAMGLPDTALQSPLTPDQVENIRERLAELNVNHESEANQGPKVGFEIGPAP